MAAVEQGLQEENGALAAQGEPNVVREVVVPRRGHMGGPRRAFRNVDIINLGGPVGSPILDTGGRAEAGAAEPLPPPPPPIGRSGQHPGPRPRSAGRPAEG